MLDKRKLNVLSSVNIDFIIIIIIIYSLHVNLTAFHRCQLNKYFVKFSLSI